MNLIDRAVDNHVAHNHIDSKIIFRTICYFCTYSFCLNELGIGM